MNRILALSIAAVVSTTSSAPLFADDVGWPRTKPAGEYQVTVYQPQIEAWAGYRTLDFRAAISVGKAGAKEPAYGVVVAHADTNVDWQARTVLVMNIKYSKLAFPGSSSADAPNFAAIARQAFPEQHSVEISLDRMLANVQQTKESQRNVAVNLEAPPIFYSSSPAILVVFTGAPSWQPCSGTKLLFATNTNWPVFMQTGTSNYFLLDEGSWLTTTDLQNGPWLQTTTLPADFNQLPVGDDWGTVRAALPPKLTGAQPLVFVSLKPAELIVTAGDPQLVSISNTMLMYVRNTESDLFLDAIHGTYYHLAAGRWFSASDLTGPWLAAQMPLPIDFTKIPVDSPKADVLASVAGSPQAQEAVIQASIPHTASVNKTGVNIAVAYDGAPDFAPIAGSENVRAAQNTTDDVFQVGSQYFCCHDGIWFEAADPAGPWSVCAKVAPQIYTIPATSPYHNVTYVYVYDTSDTNVVVGYTAGYTGEYVSNGLLYFGAGYWLGANAVWGPYSPWRYSPCYYSYGCAAHYNYYEGGYVRGATCYGPYCGAGYGARYNPATGVYSRGAAVYGPAGAAGVASAYNPWTGRGAATAQTKTPYGSWSHSVVYGKEGWAETGHSSNAWGTTAGVKTSTGAAGAVHTGATGTTAVARGAGGNVYAGHDGNVYRSTPNNGWEKHTESGWQSTGTKPAPPPPSAQHPASTSTAERSDVSQQLDRDSASRDWGNYRSADRSYGGGRRR